MWSGRSCLLGKSACLVFNALGHRELTTTICLHKGNTRRPRVAVSGIGSVSEKAKARKDSAREVLSTTNRQKWEQNNARLEELRGRKPLTSVYLASNYEPTRWNFAEALQALREAAHPDMYDCMENPIRAKFTLNMQTKKKTKFIQKFEAHVVLPHQLTFLPKPRVLALCKDTDDPSTALAQGAVDAGGTELFSRLEHGAFHWEEYDIVVAHTDWADTIGKLRHVLKERLPTLKNGRLGQDVPSLVSTYANGVSLESTRLEGVPEINYLDVILGQLSWDEAPLTDNLQCYFETIELNKSSRVVGDGIMSVYLSCPPTGEQFLLNHDPFMNHLRPAETTVDAEENEDVDQIAAA